MNDLFSTDEWEELKDTSTAKKPFSYNACCKATLSEQQSGQLKYKHGHDGVGVAFATTIGDGYFPVFAKYDEDGKLLSVTIKILED